ncbi:MAG: hypothetical protein ABJJ44_14400 [Paraglaciecola sp.]|uniref:hypothetical protein n=1 Tax=Paraglaciecola sp. TaxID=1920173 RepID=UPI003296F6EA
MITSRVQPVLLAAFVWLGTYSNSALAHALPGSNLTFYQKNNLLKLSLSFPLEDLVIAAPQFAKFQEIPANQDVPKTQVASLAVYFNEHLQLQHETKPLPYTLDRASVHMAQTHNAGSFMVLQLECSFRTNNEASVFPMRLRYDAVMHEVRTHKAAVYWLPPKDGTPINIARFRYNSRNDDQGGILLQLK